MSLMAIGQIGFNLPLTSLPDITLSLHAEPARASLILSIYVAGLASGFLLSGPLADRYGRRPVMLWGLGIFTIAALGSAAAWSEPALLTIRAIQGAAGASSVVVGRAVARDLFDGSALVKATARITMAMAVVPGLAPLLGSAVTAFTSWRVTMALGGALGAALLVWSGLRLPETGHPNAAIVSTKAVGNYLRLLGDRRFLAGAVASSLAIAALYAFFAGAPGVLVGPQGLTATQFAAVPIATAVPYVLGGWLLTKLSDRDADRSWLLRLAWGSMLLGCGLLVGLGVVGRLETAGVVAGTCLYAFGLGIVLPTGSAQAVADFPKDAGIAGALLGATQMSFGALAGAAVGLFDGALQVAFPATMAIVVVASLLVSMVMRPRS